MPNYAWNVNGDGLWTTPSNWSPNTGYPQSSTDSATASSSLTKNVSITLNSTINLLGIYASSSNTNIYQTNIIGTGEIVFSSSNSIISRSNDNDFLGNISVKVTAILYPLGITGTAYGSNSTDTYWNLKNPANTILQLKRASVVGFDTVECLGIQHADYIFDNSTTGNIGTTGLICTGAGGILDKSLWSGAGSALRLKSDGTGAFKVGRSGVSINVSSGARFNGDMSPQSDSNDNEFKNNIVFQSGANDFRKYGASRWILSGSISKLGTTALPLNVYEGVLQVLASSLVSSTTPLNSVTITGTGCLEVKGTATLTTAPVISLGTNIVGPNRMGAFRATSGSNITVSTLDMGNGVKISAALNATLTIPAFAQSPNNYTVYFGGEGTVDLQFALGGTITTVSVNKEDSGTLKMSTNDKTYLAPTNIGAGTLWCDGPTRISGSNLVTVANGARLRAGYSNIGATALSVKALTLAAGSTVQVG